MWSNYIITRSLDEAAHLLAEHRERARIVAGATDLIIELERKVRKGIETLIDISRVEGASEISIVPPALPQPLPAGTFRPLAGGEPTSSPLAVRGQSWIHLGPLVTHAQACASLLIQARALPLAQACWEVGAPQIRNRATIAGNVITASPANDTITPLMALDAVVTLRSAERGDRTVPLREFYTGVRRTVMQPDEILVDIAFPALQADERGMFIKLGLRRAQAISVVNVAAVIRIDPHPSPLPEGEGIRGARIALGCVAPTIVRCDEAETFLVGKTLTEDVIEQAGVLAQRAAKPIDDIRAPADYRRDMVAVVVKRALRAIAGGQERGLLPEKPVMLGAANPLTLPLPQGERSLTTTINGKSYSLPNAQEKTLLRALREDAGLIGTKEGCAEGECGACTVFMDGVAVMSCLVPAPRAHGAVIETVEGLANGNTLHPLQQAFVDEAAVQCGYCTPGFIMTGAKLLEERPNATQAEVQEAISGNLCRCTGYYKILAAFETAKKEVIE